MAVISAVFSHFSIKWVFLFFESCPTYFKINVREIIVTKKALKIHQIRERTHKSRNQIIKAEFFKPVPLNFMKLSITYMEQYWKLSTDDKQIHPFSVWAVHTESESWVWKYILKVKDLSNASWRISNFLPYTDIEQMLQSKWQTMTKCPMTTKYFLQNATNQEPHWLQSQRNIHHLLNPVNVYDCVFFFVVGA